MALATPSSLQLPNTTLPRMAEGRFLSSVKTAASQSPSGLHGSRTATWAGGFLALCGNSQCLDHHNTLHSTNGQGFEWPGARLGA